MSRLIQILLRFRIQIYVILGRTVGGDKNNDCCDLADETHKQHKLWNTLRERFSLQCRSTMSDICTISSDPMYRVDDNNNNVHV